MAYITLHDCRGLARMLMVCEHTNVNGATITDKG